MESQYSPLFHKSFLWNQDHPQFGSLWDDVSTVNQWMDVVHQLGDTWVMKNLEPLSNYHVVIFGHQEGFYDPKVPMLQRSRVDLLVPREEKIYFKRDWYTSYQTDFVKDIGQHGFAPAWDRMLMFPHLTEWTPGKIKDLLPLSFQPLVAWGHCVPVRYSRRKKYQIRHRLKSISWDCMSQYFPPKLRPLLVEKYQIVSIFDARWGRKISRMCKMLHKIVPNHFSVV